MNRRAKAKFRRLKRSKSRTWCQVYGLRDVNGDIRYVGQTRCALDVRMAFHRRNAKRPRTPVEHWLKAETDAGNPVQIVLLEPEGTWNVTEVQWIFRLRVDPRAAQLLNATEGGDSPSIKQMARRRQWLAQKRARAA